MHAHLGSEADDLLMLLDVHGAQHGGLNLTDVSERPRDMIVTKNRRRARGRELIVRLLEFSDALACFFQRRAISRRQLLRPRARGWQRVDIHRRARAAPLRQRRHHSGLGRACPVKIVTGEALLIGDVLGAVFPPVFGKGEMLWHHADLVRSSARDFEGYRLATPLRFAMK